MRKPLPSCIVLLLVSAAFFTLGAHSTANGDDPCDSYGDCVSSSITYVRSNPDHTLYLGDQFVVTLSVIPGSGSTSCGSGCSESWSGQLSGMTWSYDNTAFHANATESLADFIVVANSTASYPITATASFLVTVTTCVTTTGPNGESSTSCNASVTMTSVAASETVELRSFILNFQTTLVNVTATNGLVTGGKELLRNSDGSFYRNDSFCDSWNATFKFASERTDVKINITSVTPISLRILNYSSEPLGRSGSFCYVVAANSAYRPYDAVLVARALNWQGVTLGLRERTEPFAVVQYQPHFTYFTYMLYNSKNASTYGRPFVTLVRYGGNNPGYSYAGDANTAPIIANNDTGQRAWINDFTFSTQGWNATVRLVDASVGQDIQFNRYPVSVSYRYLNKTYPVITWADRVQKYYFEANVADFERYVPDGVIYYNLTKSAYSANFAGASRQWLFNTTYLYEPVQYGGYLIFKFHDASGNPDTSANMTIVSHNPSPLNVYLIDRAKAKFGDDPAVLRAFEKDLYPSNYTTILKQLQPNKDGTIVYLVNQTNLAMVGNSAFPSFNVTIYSAISGTSYQFTSQYPYLTGGTTTYCPTAYWYWWAYYYGFYQNCKEVSYQIPNRFSLFLINGSTLPSLPFTNATAYYLMHDLTNLALPVNSTLSGGPAYHVNWYAAMNVINPNIPVSQEPGHLTTLHQLIYGQNSTVYVNTAGGNINFSRPEPLQGGVYYRFSFLVNPQSGGLSRVWIVNDRGVTLTNETLLPTTSYNSSFSLPGYFGPYSTTVPLDNTNGTVTITLLNPWGAKTVINGVQVTPYVPPPSSFPWGMVTIIVLVLVGVSLLSKALKVKMERQEQEGEEGG